VRARKPIAKSDQRKIQTFHRVCHEEGVRVESETRLAERIVSNVEFEIELRCEFARSARKAEIEYDALIARIVELASARYAR